MGADGDEGSGEVSEEPHVPSARPAMLALGAVVAISLALVAGTVIVNRQTTGYTTMLAENSLRSVQLVGNIQHHVTRIEVAAPSELPELVRRLDQDLMVYRPLAVLRMEREVLAQFEERLRRIFHENPSPRERALSFARLHDTLDRLVRINTRGAAGMIAQIESARRTALGVQIAAALLTLAAIGFIASVLHRVMRRQRALVEREIESLSDRNRDLTAFVGRTAHDLRGPLTPIRGYADLLAAGSADVAKAASRIQSASEQMASIIEDLLMLSTSGHLPAGESDVAPIVREVVADLAPALGDAETRTELEECRAACTQSVLRQLLHNVIGNAAKYRSPARRLELTIEVRGAGELVEIAITDNGMGMTPETLQHAFEPYYRPAEVRHQPGSGLGLSIVKRMLDALGGSCALTSELGVGTRFVIRLPRAPP